MGCDRIRNATQTKEKIMSDITTFARPVTNFASTLREYLPSSGYISNIWENDGVGVRSHYFNNVWDSQAMTILEQALFENDEHDAYKENEARGTLARVTVTDDADTEAALRQAELLGATADQRNKLRAIVTARIEADREVARLRQELSVARTEPITDPQDRRVWSILGAAAEEADRQGYCSTYEQIATAVGMPTRDTLKATGFASNRVQEGHAHYTRTEYRTVTFTESRTVTYVMDGTVTREGGFESNGYGERDEEYGDWEDQGDYDYSAPESNDDDEETDVCTD